MYIMELINGREYLAKEDILWGYVEDFDDETVSEFRRDGLDIRGNEIYIKKGTKMVCNCSGFDFFNINGNEYEFLYTDDTMIELFQPKTLICIGLDDGFKTMITLDITNPDNVVIVDSQGISLEKGVTEVVENNVVQYFAIYK